MVFEQLYSIDYINKHKYLIFLISLAFTVFGIGSSVLLFRDFNHSLVSLALISLMLLVTLKDNLKLTIKPITDKEKQSMIFYNLIKEYKDNIMIFFYIYAGIMIGFSIFSMILPSTAIESVFSTQYDFLVTDSAKLIFSYGDFSSIFLNNLSVLLVCLITSFLFGIGTIFLFVVVWNASVIGVIFGIVAKQTAISVNISPLLIFIVILLASLPHIIFEISGYLLSGVTGENFSNYLLSKKNNNFSYFKLLKFSLIVLLIAIILILAGTFIENSFPSYVINIFL